MPAPPRLTLELLPETLAICRLAADSPVPDWALSSREFLTTSRTPGELSITAVQRVVPAALKCERDYRALRVRGPLAMSLVGVLASIANPLAEAKISIFAISTYDTDYVLVKAGDLDTAVDVLQRAGHEVKY